MIKKPTGYVAECQCWAFVGAIDISRADNETASRLVSDWLRKGCTLKPRFAPNWQVTIEPCHCNEIKKET